MPSTSPCPEVFQLQAFALGRLGDTEALTVGQHVHLCTNCAARLERLLGPDDPETSTNQIRFGAGKKRTVAGSPAVAPSPLAKKPNGPEAFPFFNPPIEPDEIGRLAAYRVLRVLGRGGMGIVFLAEDLTLRRPVALKVLKQDLEDDCKPWERFLREARTLAAIKHEHVVTVYQAGQEGEVAYLAMELLEGQSLADFLDKTSQLPLGEVLRLSRELTTGIAVVHQHGLIHRDIKPANVWLEAPQGRVKLLDFGLARQAKNHSRLTQTGVVIGTPAYMSLEQARGLPVDERSDLFSLGCILYRLCTGSDPFHGADPMARLISLAADSPRAIAKQNPAIPEALIQIVMELLAKESKARPSSANDVLARLLAIETSAADSAARQLPQRRAPEPVKPITSGWRSWGGVFASAVLGCGVFAAMLTYFLVFPPRGESARRAPKAPATVSPEEESTVADLPSELFRSQPVRWEREQSPQPLQQKREYLCTWQPIEVTGLPNGPPPFSNPMSPPAKNVPRGNEKNPQQKGFAPEDFNPANLFSLLGGGGNPAPHGSICVCPPPGGQMKLSYALRGQYKVFSSEVALGDSSSSNPNSLTFAVYGDNRLLWKSTPGKSQSKNCTVSVQDVDVLHLAVTSNQTDSGEMMGAHGFWTEPYVAKQ